MFKNIESINTRILIEKKGMQCCEFLLFQK